MNEMSKRIISALVLIPLALFAVLWENPLLFGICLYIVIISGSKEMANLLRAGGKPVSNVIVYAGAVLIPVCFYFENHWQIFCYVLTGLVLFTFMLKMFDSNPVSGVIDFITANIFAAVFFPFFMSFIWLIRGLDNGSLWVLFLCIAIWLSDSCAYFAGVKFGTIKIVPKISPKKSLQGFLVGIVAGTAGSIFYYYKFLYIPESANLHIIQIVIIAVDVVAAGILGDLFESMLKRDAGIKDSGNLIPGHGGALDRFDSVLIAAPVLYMYLSVWL